MQKSDVQLSLIKATSHRLKNSLEVDDIIDIYFCEVYIGKYLRGFSKNNFLSEIENLSKVNSLDTVLLDCAKYANAHKICFRYIDDGWKGEYNFWEPNYYWIHYIHKYFPITSSGHKIKFDLEFKELLRRYNFAPDYECKSCREYFNEYILPHKDVYIDVTSEQDLSNWVSNCETERIKFKKEKLNLLEQYNYASYTDTLKNIDVNNVIEYLPTF